MPNVPILTIVIVAYRSCDEIGPCLRSLPAMLAGQPIEIIVVDNSPDDGAGELVQREFPQVRYIATPENLGFGRANNLGLAHSDPHGRYVLFLNPDTVCTAAAFEHCVGRLQADATIGLISPRLVLADGSMDLACRRSIPTLWDGFCRASGLAAVFPRTPLFAGYNLSHLPIGGTYDVGAINGAFMLATRRVLQIVAPDGRVFDERFFMYGDDLDLCIRVGRAGFRIVYDGSVTVIHLKGVSVAKEYDQMSRAIFDANRDVYLKHFNPRGSRWVRGKFIVAFGLWKRVALLRARLAGRRTVRPV
ncbi:glycosyltransferase family 2 protein [Opitutus terrae]|uniref:Glycosyl transferase family 2 n=1 Tax=Opitutus terrae (strain DSM 11246 / JCM 15787 / PB90-1) TaxID=452637 RepID=B1ZVX1_OPITP|nr:glycosyltransferase family 2 protein [Opitutus terrae]ACB75057.1 glycosyl transferase family 2 [Opitutus terrae PB90-1]